MLKTFLSSRWLHPLLLLVWIAIGAVLRFSQLTEKPPWTDEFATLVFSLGNSFQPVPIDRVISLETLLQPLRLNPSAGAPAVLHHLFTEDHHPPLYFLLAHWWMQLVPTSGEYVSLWAARSLPAVFGVVSIPAAYGLGFLAFRSRLVGQLAAAMSAVSPYGVFLSQEARHYTLGILWVIASVCCLVVAVQHLQRRSPLPIWLGLCWVVVNSLGIATHYFFCLTLAAEALVLIGFWLSGSRFTQKLGKFFPTPHSPLPLIPFRGTEFPTPPSYWWRIGAVAVGTLVGCLVWVPVWQASASEEMTAWIMRNNPTLLTFISPIFQALATWITMLCLLPVESPALLVMIASGLAMLVYFIWAVPILYGGLKVQLKQPDTGLAIAVLGGFVLGAIAIIFGITYFLGADLTRGARYNFVYFPAVPILLGAALAASWNASKTINLYEVADKGTTSTAHSTLSTPSVSRSSLSRLNGKPAVTLIWLVSLLSGITVVSNLGYRKYYRPDLLVPTIQQVSSVPVLIATTHNTLVQTGEMMGVAWELKRIAKAEQLQLKPQFLLAHQDQYECRDTVCPASTTLKQTLAQLPRPLDLWLVNFKAPIEPDLPNCFAEDASQYQTDVNGYSSRLYHCVAENSEASRRID